MTDNLRIFVNEKPYRAARGSTLLDLLESQFADIAESFRTGSCRATDGVGRQLKGDYSLRQGDVIRLLGTRSGESADN